MDIEHLKIQCYHKIRKELSELGIKRQLEPILACPNIGNNVFLNLF